MNPVNKKEIALYFNEISLQLANEYISTYHTLATKENENEHLEMISVSATDLLHSLSLVTSKGLCEKGNGKQFAPVKNMELRSFSAILMIGDEFRENMELILSQ